MSSSSEDDQVEVKKRAKKRPGKKESSSDSINQNDSNNDVSEDEGTSKKSSNKGSKKSRVETVVDANGDELFALGGKDRFISVSRFKGRVLINIREYYQKDGKLMPGKKGISLSQDQFYALEKLIPEVKNRISNV